MSFRVVRELKYLILINKICKKKKITLNSSPILTVGALGLLEISAS